MKNVFGKIGLAFVMLLSLGMFTSCEEENVTIVYALSVERIDDADLKELIIAEEITKITAEYLDELDVVTPIFTKQGSISACDNDVIDACKDARTELQESDFSGQYDVTLINKNTGKIIYSREID